MPSVGWLFGIDGMLDGSLTCSEEGIVRVLRNPRTGPERPQSADARERNPYTVGRGRGFISFMFPVKDTGGSRDTMLPVLFTESRRLDFSGEFCAGFCGEDKQT
jgi:hypothetical protein